MFINKSKYIIKSGGTVWHTQAVSVQRKERSGKFHVYYGKSYGYHERSYMYHKKSIYIMKSHICIIESPTFIMTSGSTVWQTQAVSVQRKERSGNVEKSAQNRSFSHLLRDVEFRTKVVRA